MAVVNKPARFGIRVHREGGQWRAELAWYTGSLVYRELGDSTLFNAAAVVAENMTESLATCPPSRRHKTVVYEIAPNGDCFWEVDCTAVVGSASADIEPIPALFECCKRVCRALPSMLVAKKAA